MNCASLLALAAFTAFVTMTAPPAVAASKVMTMVDTDHDGTIDMKEAQAAASALFARLDSDHDRTLDMKELRGRVTRRELKAADPDNDGTIDEKEFLALVAKRFQAANPDNDGTIDERELASPAGRSLRKLISP